MVERRIKAAKFPTVKSLDSFDFAALPSLNKALVMELARSEYVTRRENVIAVGNSGTGKPHIGLGLGLAACQKGLSVGFNTAAALVHESLGGSRRQAVASLPAPAMCLSHRPAPSFCSRCSASVMAGRPAPIHRRTHRSGDPRLRSRYRGIGAANDRCWCDAERTAPAW